MSKACGPASTNCGKRQRPGWTESPSSSMNRTWRKIFGSWFSGSRTRATTPGWSAGSTSPKGKVKWRPLGIPVLEDKLVQLAVAQILSAIYEADFLPCNQGYRPERGAQPAARELAEVLTKGRIEFVVEVDIKGYFEHLQHPWLLKMLALRIADGALLG